MPERKALAEYDFLFFEININQVFSYESSTFLLMSYTLARTVSLSPL